jgi:hypothetical protein
MAIGDINARQGVEAAHLELRIRRGPAERLAVPGELVAIGMATLACMVAQGTRYVNL